MGMISIAATGETLEQIQNVLHFPKQPMMTDFGFKALNESLKSGVAIGSEPVRQLTPTNTIWTQKGSWSLPRSTLKSCTSGMASGRQTLATTPQGRAR